MILNREVAKIESVPPQQTINLIVRYDQQTQHARFPISPYNTPASYSTCWCVQVLKDDGLLIALAYSIETGTKPSATAVDPVVPSFISH